jgi:isopenicillin-N epimerase
MMFGKHLRDLWLLDPGFTFVNHGSFGACPRAVLAAQTRYRTRLESQPLRFFLREYEEALGVAREALSDVLGVRSGELAFVTNATTGVNTVLRGLTLRAGDELLVTDQAYGACRNALEFVAQRSGATIVVATLPWPVANAGEVTDAIVSRATPRTRIALIDHITSATGLVLPIQAIVEALGQRGVDVLVDGAHGPGHVPLDLDGLGAAWYTGNCHKWLCAPKGSAFIYVREDLATSLRPLVISHGAGLHWGARSQFRREFDWQGTTDPSAWLAVLDALTFLRQLAPGGLPAVMEHNRSLALRGRDIVSDALEVDPACPDDMVGCLASIPLGPAQPLRLTRVLASEPLQDKLYAAGVEVPIVRFPSADQRLIRISAQVYNCEDDYRHLADVLYKNLVH